MGGDVWVGHLGLVGRDLLGGGVYDRLHLNNRKLAPIKIMEGHQAYLCIRRRDINVPPPFQSSLAARVSSDVGFAEKKSSRGCRRLNHYLIIRMRQSIDLISLRS